MPIFVRIPTSMTEKHYCNYNIAIINCLVHVLQSGRLTAEDNICFLDVLKKNNFVEYSFVKQTIDNMLGADVKNERVRDNLIYLCQILVGNQNAMINGTGLISSLYHVNLILNWPEVIKRLSDPNENIHDDEFLIKELMSKIETASRYKSNVPHFSGK